MNTIVGGKTENKELTGYPSIDKPWLKYYDEARRLAERNGAHTKTIPAEQEVRDILNDAAENPGKYDWKMLTVTDWAGYWLCLRKFNSAQIGKALEQCGVASEKRLVSNVCIKLRRVPVYRKTAL